MFFNAFKLATFIQYITIRDNKLADTTSTANIVMSVLLELRKLTQYFRKTIILKWPFTV